MVTVKQGSGNKRTFDEAQIPSLLILQELVAKRLIAFHFCDDGADLDPKFSASFQPTAAIDQAIVIALKRPDEDRYALSILGDRRLEALDLDLQPVIKPTGTVSGPAFAGGRPSR
jgi:hypothetical protein